jgi:serine/threonine protein kinase
MPAVLGERRDEKMSNLTHISFQSAATYTFIEKIGSGGMGIVFLAEKECEGVRDLVVLKTIRELNDSQLTRLKREANIAAALRHENIVRTFGLEAIPFDRLPPEFQQELRDFKRKQGKQSTVGDKLLSNMRLGLPPTVTDPAGHKLVIPRDEYSGRKIYLMVMEYVEGWDLRVLHKKHVRTGLFLPIALNAFFISRICRALEYAHKYIVHRDLSPENILINQQGVTKLMDFGIAVAADQESFGRAGKIQYMAPEQVVHDFADNRSDIFSLGLVAYYLMTGISIFATPKGLTFQQQADCYEKMLKNTIVPPHEVCSDIPETYSEIVMKMLEIDPEKRYQSIVEAGCDIEKKYIYSKGFGPTNNSFAAYLKIFGSQFQLYTEQDLQQLTFLADENKKYRIRRKIDKSLYTSNGRNLLKQRQSVA